jgi:hypothetical protein
MQIHKRPEMPASIIVVTLQDTSLLDAFFHSLRTCHHITICMFTCTFSHVMAQAVSRWPVTAEAQV